MTELPTGRGAPREGCPTPDKYWWGSRAEACYALQNQVKIDGRPVGNGRPYQCKKHWHLTSKPCTVGTAPAGTLAGNERLRAVLHEMIDPAPTGTGSAVNEERP
jgi:hypothetical protein